MHCIVNEKKGPGFKKIDAFKFSPDSSRYVYGAATENGGVIVVDGTPEKEYVSVGEAYFSPDSKHVVYRITGNDFTSTTVLDGKVTGNRYNGIGKYLFSDDSRHVAYTAMISLKKSIVVVDGIAQCADQKFNIIGNLFFSPDGNHIAYHVCAGNKNEWKLVVDGHVLNNTYGGFIKDTPIIWDSPNHFHTIALREPGPEFLLVEVDIPKTVKLESEISSL